MSEHYILEGKKAIPVDLMTWARWYENINNRRVEFTSFGDVEVSTVFMGLDHSFGSGKPLIFETMIFGGKHDNYQVRYSTWDEAVKGHHEACQLAAEL